MKRITDLFKSMRNHPWLTALVIVLDLLFVFLVMAFFALMILSIIPQLRIIDELIKTLPPSEDPLATASNYETLAGDPTLIGAFARVKFSLVFFGVMCALCWFVVEGLSWFVSQKALSHGESFFRYYRKFFVTSIFFGALALLGIVATMFVAWKSIISFVETIAVVNVGLLMYLVIVFFIATIVLSSLSQPKCIKHSVKVLSKKLPEAVIIFSAPLLVIMGFFYVLKFALRNNNAFLAGLCGLLMVVMYSISKFVWQKEVHAL